MSKQSPRLSNDSRPVIVRSVITHQLQPEYTALCERGASIADGYYYELVPKFVRDLPKGVCIEVDQFQIKVGDDVEEVKLNGQFQVRDITNKYTSYSWFKEPDNLLRPFPYNKSHGVVAVLSHEDKTAYYRQFDDHRKAKWEFCKKFAELQKEISALLYSFTSVKALVEAWPEVAPFVPENISLPKLPALPIAALNERLGLR